MRSSRTVGKHAKPSGKRKPIASRSSLRSSILKNPLERMTVKFKEIAIT